MSDGVVNGATATFELERFDWDNPGQLELAGRFSGLVDIPPDAPVLVVHGDDASFRLPAVPGSVDWPPANDEAWSAAFAWDQPPAPFATAYLELGDGRQLELPDPGAKRPRLGRRVLELRNAEAAEPPEPAQAPAPQTDVGAHAELVLAREETHAAATRAQQAEERLARADADLEAERALRAADGERFREALAVVQATAEEALAAEQSANAQLGEDLRTAHEELLEARTRAGELDAAAERAREAAAEAERLRDELERAEGSAREHEADAQRLRERLAGIRQALDEDR